MDLPAREHRGLLEATLLLAGIRLALWLTRFDVLRRRLDLVRCRRFGISPERKVIMQVRRHVDVASRYIPGASCLTQALAAQVLLRRRGWESTLRIGVKLESAGLKAHAWLECESIIVVGGEVMSQFTPLPPIQ